MKVSNNDKQFYSHSGIRGKKGLLRNHLKDVAHRASKYSEIFGASDEAYLAGILHDLGKYGYLFQRRLAGKEKGIDHWSAGAWSALVNCRQYGIAVALAIQGHHIGLQRGDNDSLRELNLQLLSKSHPLGLRLSESDINLLMERFKNDGLQLNAVSNQSLYDFSTADQMPAAAMLDIRLLYSVLVDADFIETEAHFARDESGNKVYRKNGPSLQTEKAIIKLNNYLNKLAHGKDTASPEVMNLRADLLNKCREASLLSPGLFTLTAPTGSGKTLSMLAFALLHAKIYGLRRIIVVIPYLNIIEQTVKVYQDVFGDTFESNYILEDHSLAGINRENADNNLLSTEYDSNIQRHKNFLAENWDSPIVITTSVQFLESLFSNRPGACRKLHRLAKSLILFDEVQTLPTRLVVPTLATLSRLAERYSSSVVFSTATQPAFSHLDGEVKKYCQKGWRPREIASPELNLFKCVRRTYVEWPDFEQKTSWADLVNELSKYEQIMCIVNLKRHAQLLFKELYKNRAENLFHLSTNMCPAHRKSTLDSVRDLLKNRKPCRLIATQCVEAGVDIDFPIVYRAMGPLDSIAQAAGRCNRNGNQDKGMVKVFIPDDNKMLYPDGAYRQAADVAMILLKRLGVSLVDIHDTEIFSKYYRELYSFIRPESQNPELLDAIKAQDFEDVARKYHVIDKNAINVLISYDSEIYEQLKLMAQKDGLTHRWIALARPNAIGMYRPTDNNPQACYLDPVPIWSTKSLADDWFIYTCREHYDQKLGLLLPTDDCTIA